MSETRRYWVDMLTKICRPVLENLKNQTLLENCEIETPPGPRAASRSNFFIVEILGRTLQGLAPWIETPAIDEEEEKLREEFAELARQAIASAVDENSKDFGTWGYEHKTNGSQWIVDSAFLAFALIRAPHELVEKLEPKVKANLIRCLKLTRNSKPGMNNWILFSAMIEAGLCVLGEKDYDTLRIYLAMYQHEQWYVGDGRYKDGEHFAHDYYNSYVIIPFIAQLGKMFSQEIDGYKMYKDEEFEMVKERFVRYARIQEMDINADGSFVAIGRSLTYRCGAFQSLAQCAQWEMLPDAVTPAMARCALTKVMHKTLDIDGTFREDGFLTIGLYGRQLDLAENYITTASLYMTTLGFLPLGLPETNAFWSDPDEKTSSEKIWSGENVKADKKIDKH